MIRYILEWRGRTRSGWKKKTRSRRWRKKATLDSVGMGAPFRTNRKKKWRRKKKGWREKKILPILKNHQKMMKKKENKKKKQKQNKKNRKNLNKKSKK